MSKNLSLPANAHRSIKTLFDHSVRTKEKVRNEHMDEMVEIAHTLAQCFADGGKVMFCGNGGSAADAQHLAAECLVRLRSELDRDGLPALALALDTSSMTAHGNDYVFESYYARMVAALGKKGDVLIAISTSGTSPNIVQALIEARKHGVTTVGLLGKTGGDALKHCDIKLVVPSNETGRIQESHITIGHAVLQLCEDILVESGVIEPR